LIDYVNKNAMKNKNPKHPALVTREWLRDRLLQPDSNTVLGRALVAILNRQEDDEQSEATTIYRNERGFTAFDAKIGTLAATFFRDKGVVPPNLVKAWTKPMKNGFPRICRYVNQLNEVAVETARSRAEKDAKRFGQRPWPLLFERGVYAQ